MSRTTLLIFPVSKKCTRFLTLIGNNSSSVKFPKVETRNVCKEECTALVPSPQVSCRHRKRWVLAERVWSTSQGGWIGRPIFADECELSSSHQVFIIKSWTCKLFRNSKWCDQHPPLALQNFDIWQPSKYISSCARAFRFDLTLDCTAEESIA